MEIVHASESALVAPAGFPVGLRLYRNDDSPDTVYLLAIDPSLRARGLFCAPAYVDEGGVLMFYLQTSHAPVELTAGQRIGALCRMT